MGNYDADIAPEDLPDEIPPDLEIAEPDVPETDLESFIDDGNYVVYRQQGSE